MAKDTSTLSQMDKKLESFAEEYQEIYNTIEQVSSMAKKNINVNQDLESGLENFVKSWIEQKKLDVVLEEYNGISLTKCIKCFR